MKTKFVSITLISLICLTLVVPLIACSPGNTSPTTFQGDPKSQGATSNPPIISMTGKEIWVFAGSASKPALDETASSFEEQTGIKVYVTYGGSGTVLSQMELSRSGDVYIPGSPDYMMKAESKGLIDPATTKIVAYLIPAINIQPGNPRSIQSLSDLGKPGVKVGIGNPTTVCVGLYAIEILDKSNLLSAVYKNIVTQASSCDNTATLISLKSVDAVMGWSVFRDWDPQNIDTVNLQPEQIPRLAYIPAAISSFAKEKDAANDFIDFLTSTAGNHIFRKWGYAVTEDEVRKYAPNAHIGGEYQLPDSYKALTK